MNVKNVNADPFNSMSFNKLINLRLKDYYFEIFLNYLFSIRLLYFIGLYVWLVVNNKFLFLKDCLCQSVIVHNNRFYAHFVV